MRGVGAILRERCKAIGRRRSGERAMLPSLPITLNKLTIGAAGGARLGTARLEWVGRSSVGERVRGRMFVAASEVRRGWSHATCCVVQCGTMKVRCGAVRCGAMRDSPAAAKRLRGSSAAHLSHCSSAVAHRRWSPSADRSQRRLRMTWSI